MEIAEAAGYAYTLEQITSKAFNLIQRSQAFPEGCREWKRKTSINKTWHNLKQHFSLEAKEYRKQSAHLAKDTYHTANTTNQALLEAQTEFRDFTSSFLSEFKDTFVKPNQEQVNSTKQNTTLYETVQELKGQVQDLRAQNAALLAVIQSFSTDKENRNPNQNSTNQNVPWKYCWSHGASKTHASHQCIKKKEGHKDDATFADTKGGSTFNFHIKGVKSILAKQKS